MMAVKKIAVCVLAVSVLAGCSHLTRRDTHTITGAGIGAVAGAILTGGSGIGTAGGAAVGGVIGHELGR